jgi:hypothetical protein
MSSTTPLPHANIFSIGTPVIKTHTRTRGGHAAKTAVLRINLNVEDCGIVAAQVHAPSRAPLLLPLLLSHNLPLPRVHYHVMRVCVYYFST